VKSKEISELDAVLLISYRFVDKNLWRFHIRPSVILAVITGHMHSLNMFVDRLL